MDDEFGTAAEERPHDVLAAEMFAVPAPDPILHHGPLTLPGDLTGTEEPRDVLAAEEFAMPAPPEARLHSSRAARVTEWQHSVAVWALLILFVAFRLRRRTRRAST